MNKRVEKLEKEIRDMQLTLKMMEGTLEILNGTLSKFNDSVEDMNSLKIRLFEKENKRKYTCIAAIVIGSIAVASSIGIIVSKIL